MAEAELEIEHKFSRDEAVSKLRRLLVANGGGDSLLRGLDFARDDDEFSFSGKIKGIEVSGVVRVFDRSVRILVSLPWAAQPFRESAGRYIREYFEANLA
ncbi:MAG: hypothetical protein V3V55_03010 [Rhodospirillales bacterium]